MIGILLRAIGLLVVYLLVLTSVAPGDVLIGSVLALGIVLAARRGGMRPHGARSSGERPVVAREVRFLPVEILCAGGDSQQATDDR